MEKISTSLWTPLSEQIAQTQMKKFQNVVEKKTKQSFKNYAEFHQWSIDSFESFWSTWLESSGIIYEGNLEPVVTKKSLPFSPFFPQIKLNFAENLLRKRGTALALRSKSESRDDIDLTFEQLHTEVAQKTHALKALGVGVGDRVAGFLPNSHETVIAMLATTALGATWSSCSPDFGVQGVVDRFGQISPKVLFCANAYVYQGKNHSCLEKIEKIIEAIPAIKKVVMIPFVKKATAEITSLKNKLVFWNDFTETSLKKLEYVRLPFNHPLYIMYSSGTTGVPKCIVHGAGGTLLQHTKELMLHSDLREGDRIMYFTTCGWMMWNWLVSSLFTGATLTLYDGSPVSPHTQSLWELAEKHRFTHFGISPKYIGLCRTQLPEGPKSNLDSLRVILSTGSPLLPEDFDYVYKKIKTQVQLSSISGGTDIISCFMLGNPALPVIRGEIQCLGLGMDVASFDDSQKPVFHEKGELVCRTPFPSAPIEFWNDPDQKKYLKAYFEKNERIWFHGDYIEITKSQGTAGGIIVYGRSDATLNPGGVRIGTAEIYRVVESIPEVLDSLVVGQPWEGDIRVILFVKLREGVKLNDELKTRISKELRTQNSPRHVPHLILPVEKIPYTISGKKVELAVLKIIQGEEPKNKDALLDPTALNCFRNILPRAEKSSV